mmetsp:Transcript_39112/g.116333  ORF Transcript_39112/g.116333 Transcript_39112/m.116333 type:complete len:217 (+) Transcript_39112:1981-2631(+)
MQADTMTLTPGTDSSCVTSSSPSKQRNPSNSTGTAGTRFCMNAMVLLLSCASSSTRRSIDMSSCESVIRPPSVASLETCRHVASAALLVLNSRSMSRPTATLSVSNISSTTPAPKLMPNASVAWRDSGRPPTATLTTDSMAALPAVVHTSTILILLWWRAENTHNICDEYRSIRTALPRSAACSCSGSKIRKRVAARSAADATSMCRNVSTAGVCM